MTTLKALEVAIADAAAANMLNMKDKAVNALHAVADLARDLVAQAEHAQLAAEQRADLLESRLQVLERRAGILTHLEG